MTDEKLGWLSLIGMLCVLGLVIYLASIAINIVDIQVTQVDINTFIGCTIIYDHGGAYKYFWGTNHDFEVGKSYRIIYKAGIIHPTILKIEVL